MNNTEPFDEWVRNEVNHLHDAPPNFDSGALWQKMQTQMSAVASSKRRKYFALPTRFFSIPTRLFVMPTKEASMTAACVSLLLLAGLWWQWPKVEKAPLAHNKTKALEVANAKPPPPLRGTPPRRGLARPHSLPSAHLAVVKSKNSEALKMTVEQLVDAKTEPIIAKEVMTQTLDNDNTSVAEEITLPAEPVPPPAQKTKPKFKIVHANELADYQRTELAENRAKEAEKQGFVVINWQQKDQTTAQTLRTYLRNKSSKSN